MVGCGSVFASRLAPTVLNRRTAVASHHSTGRALARLKAFDLGLLIYRPLGRLSGGVHPGSGAQRRSTQSNTLHVGRSEADRRAVSPDGYRNEGTPSLSEGPDARGETFGYFGAFAKVTRRKGGTISGRYRRNGYVHRGREWSSVRTPSRAGSLPQFDLSTSDRDWSSVRTPSQASQLPQFNPGTSGRNWSDVRTPSRAGSLPQVKQCAAEENQ
jgi:hypothetical protein